LVVAEIEFREIAWQMRLADMVIGTDDAALRDRKEVLQNQATRAALL
jgi:hypothetical protein